MRKSKRSVVPAAVVDLALLREAGMIAATVARGLGISQDSARSIEDELIEFLRKKRRLLLFDTVKHLPVAATLLGDLCHAAPGLTVLVTGRAAPPNERARGADRAACRAGGRDAFCAAGVVAAAGALQPGQNVLNLLPTWTFRVVSRQMIILPKGPVLR